MVGTRLRKLIACFIFSFIVFITATSPVIAQTPPKLAVEKTYFKSEPIQYGKNRLYILIKSEGEDFDGIINVTYQRYDEEIPLINDRQVSIIANDHVGLFSDVSFDFGGEITLKIHIKDSAQSILEVSNDSSKVTVSFDTDKDGKPNQTDEDDDNDGLADALEATLGTSPTSPDSDGDGIGDAQDKFPTNGNESQDSDNDGIGNTTDPDDDNDGILDTQEAVLGTSTQDSDTDHDGLSDLQETKIGTDPKNADSDKDGVKDGDDIAPLDPAISNDSDKDGIADEIENKEGLDPENKSDAKADSDKDGISNIDELLKYHTDPRQNDTDKDGLPDKFEIDHNLNPILSDDAKKDADVDGLSNTTEYTLHLNPDKKNTFLIPDLSLLFIIPGVFVSAAFFIIKRKKTIRKP